MSLHASSPGAAPGRKKGKDGPLFADVAFWISPTLAPAARANLAAILAANGALKADLHTASHIVSDTDTFDGWNKVPKDTHIVTPAWVERSVAIKTQQNPKGFSANPRMIFSGIVASSADLPEGDKETMRSSITALGGQWREMLTRDVTHFFCITEQSEKYQKAMSYREQSQMRVLLPHWWDDSFNARRLVPYKAYLFPDPPLYDTNGGLKALADGDEKGKGKVTTDSGHSKELLYRTALLADDGPLENETYSSVDVWQARRVYLSKSLDLGEGRRHSVEIMLERGGARIVQFDEEDEHELKAVDACDILVTRYRDGKAFERALRDEKVIGTLAWVLHVQHQGKYSSPLDQLLHFPIPRWTLPGMEAQMISITNYSGAAREYLKKIVEIMGGNFTSTLSHANTHVVAASLTGKKTDKARDWNIPIVNHLWLEDCFVEWKLLTTANPKYISFPRHDDATIAVGECGIGKYTIEDYKEAKKLHAPKDRTPQRPGTQRAERTQDEEEEIGDSRLDVTLPNHKLRAPSSKVSDFSVPPATNTSMRDANEVEDEMLVDADDSRTLEPMSSPAGGVPPTSSPLRRLESKPSSSSPLKRRLEATADDPHNEIQYPQTPLQRSRSGTSHVPTAGPSGSARRTAPASDVIDLVDSGDEEPANLPSPPSSRVGQKRGREEVDDEDFGRLRSSSLTPPPASSAKRHKPALESQSAAAHDALSPLTNVARRRPKASDSISETSFREDQEDDDSQRRRSGRAAAAKATKTLREVVMPDVVMFETKEKRGKKHNVEAEDDMRGTQATKTYAGRKLRATKSKSVDVEDEDEDSRRADAPAATRMRRELPATQAPSRTVLYVATMVTITEAERQALASLGAKPTTKVDQCTHLIADQIVRTEKFLTAINYAPHVVTKEWIEASVEANTLLPEANYILRHPTSEQKYKMKLSDVLRRARENKASLFKGCTFYVTDNAVADHDLIKAVVKAAGGEVKRKTPNLRQAQHENAFVVSHVKDAAVWKPLARQGIKIYASDFILNGVLRQQLPLNDVSCRLADSE